MNKLSIVEKIFLHAETYPNKSAVLTEELNKTYFEVSCDIRKACSKLLQKGISYGDRVLITTSNTYSFIVVYFACHVIEATVVSISRTFDERSKSRINELTNSNFTISNCDKFCNDLVKYDLFQNKNINSLVTADILFTSGSSGSPKGVPMTHKQLHDSSLNIVSHVRNTSDDVELIIMPLDHSFGISRMRTCFFVGGTVVIGFSTLQLKKVFKAIEQFNVTGLAFVPSAFRYIKSISRDYIKKFSTQIKYIELGSEYLSYEEKKILKDWFPNTHLAMHYGLTEVSRAIFSFFHEDDLNSVGKIGRGGIVKILRQDGVEANETEEGEICFKAKWMIKEYFNDKELTSKSFFDGYFRTGDIGFIKSQYLYLTGRLKDIINVGGKKVSPYSIEAVVNDLDVIDECACVGKHSDELGEKICIYLKKNNKIKHENNEEIVAIIKNNISAHLPHHMMPAEYFFVDKLPKTSSGKIKRFDLKQT